MHTRIPQLAPPSSLLTVTPPAAPASTDAAGVASAPATDSAPSVSAQGDARPRRVATRAPEALTPSASAAPAASATGSGESPVRSQSPVRDRKAEWAGPSLASSPSPKVPDSKHAASAVKQVTFPPADTESLRVLEQALDRVNSHFPESGSGSRSSSSLSADLRSLCDLAEDFQQGLATFTQHEARFADAILGWLAARLKERRIHEPSLRALCREISEAIEVQASIPLGCLACEFPAALKAQCADRPGLERDITRGLVDALLNNFLRSYFVDRTGGMGMESLQRHLADLSIQRPALAVAFGHARLDHEHATRQRGLRMDFLGERVGQAAISASPQALREVASALTRDAETGGSEGGGMDYWRLALEPYLLGSLRNKNPGAVVAVVEGALEAIRECRQVREASGVEGAPVAHTLNLNTVSMIFMGAAAQAAPEPRNRVHMALAMSLTKVGASHTPSKTADS